MSKYFSSIFFLIVGLSMSASLYWEFNNDRRLSTTGKTAEAIYARYTVRSSVIMSALGLDELYGTASTDIAINADGKQVDVRNVSIPPTVLKQMKAGEKVYLQYLPDTPNIVRFVGHRRMPVWGILFPLALFYFAYYLLPSNDEGQSSSRRGAARPRRAAPVALNMSATAAAHAQVSKNPVDSSMAIACPQCAYIRSPDNPAPDWQCPSCGIAYAKFQKSNTESNSNGSTRAGTHGHQFVSNAPMILCKKFAIAKSRRLQTSDTEGTVLVSRDAIYFAKDGGGQGSLLAIGGILGGAIGAVIAAAAAVAAERLITGPRLKAAGAIPFDQLPSEVQAYFARLGCSGDVVVLPRSAMKEASASLWTGINLKTDTHLFVLRVGPLEFSKVRKRLSFYKWL